LDLDQSILLNNKFAILCLKSKKPKLLLNDLDAAVVDYSKQWIK
jgi:hypothetical protein